MKRFFFALGMAAIMAGGFTACDPCDSTVCTNGVCNEGTCECNDGYLTDATTGDCTVMENSQYTGTYDVAQTCGTTGTTNYVSVADPGTAPKDIIVYDFQGVLANNVTMTIDGDDVTITSQTTDAGYTVSGTGSRLGTQLSINFDYTDNNGTTGSCTASMTMQ